MKLTSLFTAMFMAMFMGMYVLLLTAPAQADWPWKLPSLNPFAKREAPPQRSATKQNTTRAPGSGTLQRMNNGTRKFFARTTNALNPWSDSQAQPRQQAPPTGSRPSQRVASQPAQPSTWNRMTSWLRPAAEPEPLPPKSVNDFMALPRPNF